MNYSTHIKSKTGLLEINLKELYQYKDLIWLFFKRNYTTIYKQTILGPLWLVLNPLISVLLYVFVFGNIAGLSTDGSPKFIFYLASNALWTFFSTSLTTTSTTFTDNSAILGKVYFPRLVMPISSVLTACLNFIIQLGMLITAILIYVVIGTTFNIGPTLLLAPILIIQTGLLSLGFGIIIASLTTKYRDLKVLFTFGIQLWMYASPVVYSSSRVPEFLKGIYMLNPMAPIIECWRNCVIGSGTFMWGYWGISWITTIVIFGLGVLLFNRVEKTFMDTI